MKKTLKSNQFQEIQFNQTQESKFHNYFSQTHKLDRVKILCIMSTSRDEQVSATVV